MSRRTDSITGLLFGLAIAVLVAGSLVFRAEAPCSWFGLAPVKEVPARCLMHR
jgi:hypothetical protein